ncbi:MAG: glycosyltransferase family 39 protein [Aquisalimonadaceae bacterium]
MNTLLGVVALLLSGCLLVPLLMLCKGAIAPVAAGWGIRCCFAIMQGLGLVALPESDSDAVTFQQSAVLWANASWSELLAAFNPTQSYLYSWVGAALYKLFGVNPLVFHSLNVFLGSLAVLLTYALAREFVDRRTARKLCWIAALFPFAVLYSSVLLREMMIVASLMGGLLLTVRWVRTGAASRLLGAAAAFAVAALFHGGMAIALVGLAIVCFRESSSSFWSMLVTRRVNPRLLVTGIVASAALAGLVVHAVTGGMQLSSVGDTAERFSIGASDVVADQAEQRTSGGAAYPDIVASEGITDSIWVMPARIAYFLFSPFPWDIKSPGHLLGLFSSVMFFLIAIALVRSRKVIAHDRGMQAVLLIAALLVLVYSLGTYNVGTAVRHRTKVFFALIALCSVPSLKRKLVLHK